MGCISSTDYKEDKQTQTNISNTDYKEDIETQINISNTDYKEDIGTHTNGHFVENITKNDFTNKTFTNTITFTLQNYYAIARVVDIYDADTITCIMYVFNEFYKFQIRLAGIDTCEMKSHNKILKNHAYAARNRMYELITGLTIDNSYKRKQVRELLHKNNYVIRILCDKFDKYGRLLGWCYNINSQNNETINSYNNILLNEKFAYIYIGKRKLTDEEQITILSLT